MLDVEVALELSIKELLSIFNRSQTRDETLIDKVRGIKVVLLNMLDSILKFWIMCFKRVVVVRIPLPLVPPHLRPACDDFRISDHSLEVYCVYLNIAPSASNPTIFQSPRWFVKKPSESEHAPESSPCKAPTYGIRKKIVIFNQLESIP